ncbi:hypothetical protein QE400_000049 [Xanthomonas sacchari]|uniref:hypothetical protein n=1 Tax=Xanthomonas sacchari TaxID=56458 RepID=UPI00278992A1|nr:hypothetical protein [Xanthomonas sacchari]MDQ1090636.1 hypothetical protein [Xanthomonas sacchari]
MTSNAGKDELFAEIAEALQITGICLTVAQAQELLGDDDELLDTIEEWGVEDTDVLGQLANLVSQKLLNEPWPTFGDHRDPHAFEQRINAAATAQGYALVDDNEDEENG